MRDLLPAELVTESRSLPPKVACLLRARSVGVGLPPPIAGHNPEEHARAFFLDTNSEQWQETGLQRFTSEWVERQAGGLRLFTDGSVTSHSWPASARAGWGLVGMIGERMVYQAYGPVPQQRLQTAPSAEWVAAEMAAIVSHSSFGLPPVVGDCLQVVRALGSPPRVVLAQGGMHAGSLRTILAAFGGKMDMSKVKSHRLVESAVDAEDRCTIIGNEMADSAARMGADTHPKPSEAEAREANASWQLFKALACAVGKLSVVWPQARRLFGGRLGRVVEAPVGRRGKRPPRLAVPVEHQHDFQPLGGHIMCAVCLTRARSWEAVRARQDREWCTGSSSTMRVCMDSQLAGHSLVLGVWSGQAVFSCVTCGCYASTKLEGLARQCKPAKPGSHGKQAINRVLKGEHPDPKRKNA